MEYVLIASFCAAFLVLAHRLGDGGLNKARAADWEDAAAACQLEHVSTKHTLGARTLEGARGPLGVRLRSVSGLLGGRDGTRMEVTGLARLLSFGPASNVEVPGEIALGDPDFDGATQVHGEALQIQALLDAETRSRLMMLVPRWNANAEKGYRAVSLGGGAFVVECWDDPLATRVARLTETLDEALALAARLVPPKAPEECLAASVAQDPVRGVRLQSLSMLLGDRPDHPATRAAVRAALVSEDSEVRLLAALASGVEGVATLRVIAGSTEDAVAARAVAALGDELAAAETRRVLSDAIGADRVATAIASFASLDRRQIADVSLPGAMLASGPSTLVAAAVRSLGLSGAPGAERALLDALGHSDLAVRLATIESLGRVGTAAAVPALRQAESRLSWEGEYVRAVNAAIASIQSRIVGADHGQLGLAQPAGEVSLAEDARGRVSRDEP